MPGTSFLEVGGGAGVTSVLMTGHGCNVTTVDINPQAIKNITLNAQLNMVDMNVFQSDIFDQIPAGVEFDVIYWAIPWGYVEEGRPLNRLQQAIFNPGYSLLSRYVSGAQRHLAPDGRLMLGFSEDMGNGAKLREIVQANGYKTAALATGTDRDGLDLTLYELIDITT